MKVPPAVADKGPAPLEIARPSPAKSAFTNLCAGSVGVIKPLSNPALALNPKFPLREKNQSVSLLLSVTCPKEKPAPPPNAKFALKFQNEPLLSNR